MLKEIYELSETIYDIRENVREDFPFSLKQFIQENELVIFYNASYFTRPVNFPYLIKCRSASYLDAKKKIFLDQTYDIVVWLKFIHKNGSINSKTKCDAENVITKYRRSIQEYIN